MPAVQGKPFVAYPILRIVKDVMASQLLNRLFLSSFLADTMVHRLWSHPPIVSLNISPALAMAFSRPLGSFPPAVAKNG
jgi:hypothetical protein